MRAIIKLKFWALSIALAILAIILGTGRLKRRARRKRVVAADLRVAVAREQVKIDAGIDDGNLLAVVEAKHRLKLHAAVTDTKIGNLYGRIITREKRIANLRARLDALRGD